MDSNRCDGYAPRSRSSCGGVERGGWRDWQRRGWQRGGPLPSSDPRPSHLVQGCLEEIDQLRSHGVGGGHPDTPTSPTRPRRGGAGGQRVEEKGVRWRVAGAGGSTGGGEVAARVAQERTTLVEPRGHLTTYTCRCDGASAKGCCGAPARPAGSVGHPRHRERNCLLSTARARGLPSPPPRVEQDGNAIVATDGPAALTACRWSVGPGPQAAPFTRRAVGMLSHDGARRQAGDRSCHRRGPWGVSSYG